MFYSVETCHCPLPTFAPVTTRIDHAKNTQVSRTCQTVVLRWPGICDADPALSQRGCQVLALCHVLLPLDNHTRSALKTGMDVTGERPESSTRSRIISLKLSRIYMDQTLHGWCLNAGFAGLPALNQLCFSVLRWLCVIFHHILIRSIRWNPSSGSDTDSQLHCQSLKGVWIEYFMLSHHKPTKLVLCSIKCGFMKQKNDVFGKSILAVSFHWTWIWYLRLRLDTEHILSLQDSALVQLRLWCGSDETLSSARWKSTVRYSSPTRGKLSKNVQSIEPNSTWPTIDVVNHSVIIVIHLNLTLLTQLPASNEYKIARCI